MGAKSLSNLWPSHQLVDSKESEKLSLRGDFCIAGVLVNSVEEIVLLVVVGGEDDKVDDALQDLEEVRE